jgi:FixJ family two-component response regulator
MTCAPRILLVDDDPAVRSALAFSLELEGFAVEAFGSGAELLARAPLPETGCFVLDHRLHGIDGLELLASLRGHGVVLPAVIVTSNPTRSLRERIARAGAALVEKPLLGDALTAEVRRALNIRRAAA